VIDVWTEITLEFSHGREQKLLRKALTRTAGDFATVCFFAAAEPPSPKPGQTLCRISIYLPTLINSNYMTARAMAATGLRRRNVY